MSNEAQKGNSAKPMLQDGFLYITVMFPYPSGSGLHCGHYYNYAIMDSYCRYKKFIGNQVFQPFGYDALWYATNIIKKKIKKLKNKIYDN